MRPAPSLSPWRTVHDDRHISIEERPVSVAEFARPSLDISGMDSWSNVRQAIDLELNSLDSSKRSDNVIARIMLTGSTPFAWRLRRDIDLLQEEARTAARDVWIEGLEIACTAPQSAATSDAGATAELARLMASITANPDFLARAEDEANALVRGLPREARDLLGDDPATVADATADLARLGADEVLARLAVPASEAD